MEELTLLSPWSLLLLLLLLPLLQLLLLKLLLLKSSCRCNLSPSPFLFDIDGVFCSSISIVDNTGLSTT